MGEVQCPRSPGHKNRKITNSTKQSNETKMTSSKISINYQKFNLKCSWTTTGCAFLLLCYVIYSGRWWLIRTLIPRLRAGETRERSLGPGCVLIVQVRRSRDWHTRHVMCHIMLITLDYEAKTEILSRNCLMINHWHKNFRYVSLFMIFS